MDPGKLARSHQQSLKQGFSDKLRRRGHRAGAASSSRQTRRRLRTEAGLSPRHSRGLGGSWGAKELSSPASSRRRPPVSSPRPRQPPRGAGPPGAPAPPTPPRPARPGGEGLLTAVRGPDPGEGGDGSQAGRRATPGTSTPGGQRHRWGFGFTHLGHPALEGPEEASKPRGRRGGAGGRLQPVADKAYFPKQTSGHVV